MPIRTGSVPLKIGGGVTSAATSSPTSDATSSAAAAVAAAPAGKVALHALVVAVQPDEWAVDTWKATLDRVGAAYDVLYTSTAPLAADKLVRADGTGKYNAILLTSNNLLYQDASGAFVSGLTDTEWNALWSYERQFGVRQATLYNSYGTWPEDYCMRAGSEAGVGDTPVTATLTASGGAVFSDLKAAAKIPLQQSWVYYDQLAQGCDGQAVLTGSGGSILGVQTTSVDGRERLALNFTSNQYLVQANLLVYGLFRWASRGLFLGELRHNLNVDVDDWFNSSDHLISGPYPAPGQQWPDLTPSHTCSAASAPCINDDPGFQMSGHDAYNTRTQQSVLRTKYPLANTFTLNVAYNGGDAEPSATNLCYPLGGLNTLTETTRCIRDSLRWINHTLTHPKMNSTNYDTSKNEIYDNLQAANKLGMAVPATVLKTGEYSGLGVYNPNPADDINPPTDHNLDCTGKLCASNPDLLKAAKDLGVKYLHGNMSFKSHQPTCFNCSIVPALQPELTVVPDWPTNIAYFSTNPDEEAYFYNWFYGPSGKFAYWPANQTYAQVLDHESDQAFAQMATGSVYTHTFHISNLRDYGGGKTLTTDWLDAVLAKYSSYYKVPVLNPNWEALAKYTEHRNSHFSELDAGVDAVYDAAAKTVQVTSTVAGEITMSGATAKGFTTYGTEVSAQIKLAANTPVTVTTLLLS